MKNKVSTKRINFAFFLTLATLKTLLSNAVKAIVRRVPIATNR
jgi:hypothetical protein